MKYLLNKYTIPITALTIAVLLTGCDVSNSNSDAKNDRKVAVKMKVQSSSAQKTTTGHSGLALDSLSEVKMLVEELELESSVDQDSLDFEADNLIVNLPLDGSDFVLTSSTVPEGVYDEFEMEMERPDDASVNDPDFYNDNGSDEGYSIVSNGVYNGKDFIYRSQEDFELELELNPPLEVSANSAPSVAINVDPFNWFKDEAGNDLDPTDPANIEQIDENIEKSFDVEKDEDDDDGDDDDDDDDGDDD